MKKFNKNLMKNKTFLKRFMYKLKTKMAKIIIIINKKKKNKKK